MYGIKIIDNVVVGFVEGNYLPENYIQITDEQAETIKNGVNKAFKYESGQLAETDEGTPLFTDKNLSGGYGYES